MATAKKAAAKKPAAKKKAAPKAKAKPAAKGAAPKPPETATNPVFKAPGEEYFNKFVKRLDELGKTANSAAGEISTAIDAAHEQKGLDKKALSIFRALNSMPINKLQTTLPHLFLYIKFGKLEKKAATQGQLGLEKDGDQTDIEDNIPKGSKAVSLSEAAARAIESAARAKKKAVGDEPNPSPGDRRSSFKIVDAPKDGTEPLDTGNEDDGGPPEPAKSAAG